MPHSRESSGVYLGEDQEHPEKSNDDDDALRAREKKSLSFLQIYKVSRQRGFGITSMADQNRQKTMDMATFREKLLYAVGILASMGSGTVLPLMTLIFGNFVSEFTDFALGRVSSDSFRSKVNHYT